jgi:hypothetical protein
VTAGGLKSHWLIGTIPVRIYLDMYNSGQRDASIDWHALHHERPHRGGQTSRRGIGSRTRGIRMYWMRDVDFQNHERRKAERRLKLSF